MPPSPFVAALRRTSRPTLALLLLVAAVASAAALALRPGSSVAAQTPANGRFVCQQPNRVWTEIAGGPNSYVTGNCSNGTEFNRVRNSDEHQTDKRYGWEIGRIGGSYNGCGVVKGNESAVVPGRGQEKTTDCLQEPSQKRKGYIYKVDCSPKTKCSYDPDYHGDRDTRLKAGAKCQAFANYRPFSDTPAPTDPVGELNAETQKVYPFWLRYVTRDKKFALGYLGNNNPDRDVKYGRNGRSAYSAAPTGKVAGQQGMPMWVFVEIKGCLKKPRHLRANLGKERPGV